MIGRYHNLIEQIIDQFILVCQNRVDEVGLGKKVWVTKDLEDSMVNVGDPDRISSSRDFGFSIPYETILSDFSDGYNEFNFKLEHFIKIANSMDKFNVFRTASRDGAE